MEIQAYRNLNTGLWSIRSRVAGKWVVVAHCERVLLADVTVKQSEASRQRAIRTGQRNVHCMVVGALINAQGVQLKRDVTLPNKAMTVTTTRGVTYNPFIHETLVYRTGETFTGCDYCVLDTDQKMYTTN